MNPITYVFMGFGALLALLGILVFVKMGTQGTSSIKMFGFEFKLGGSALVIFVVGALLFMVPIIYLDQFVQKVSGNRHQPPATVTKRYVTVSSTGEVFLQMTFQSLADCKAAMSPVQKATMACEQIPDSVWCAPAGAEGENLHCFENGNDCQTAFPSGTLAVPCRAMVFKDAVAASSR